jgi:hypothetical protein
VRNAVKFVFEVALTLVVVPIGVLLFGVALPIYWLGNKLGVKW